MLLPVFLVVLVTLSVRQLWCSVPARVLLSGSTMGTTWSVVLNARGRSRVDRESLRARLEQRLDEINRLMSTWDPESELSRFNRTVSNEPFALSAETFTVLELAQGVSEASGGAFDVTVRPLVAAWGFGAGARIPGQGPDAQELSRLRERVGFERLELDPSARTVRKLHRELECDLSAIAKGFAVDELARTLSELGWTDFLVEIGGEVRATGERPGGGPWRVGIEAPVSERRSVEGVVELSDASMATSGDYRAFYESSGQRLSHIVDPRSGRPVSHPLASVSVVHREAAIADAWATALTVLGPDEGFARALELGLGAHFVMRNPNGGFEVRSTPGFPAVHAPPRDESDRF